MQDLRPRQSRRRTLLCRLRNPAGRRSSLRPLRYVECPGRQLLHSVRCSSETEIWQCCLPPFLGLPRLLRNRRRSRTVATPSRAFSVRVARRKSTWKDPADRLEVVGRQIAASGAKIVAGGYSFGEYDVTAVVEAPDDTTMAALSVAIVAGGAVKSGKTTRLLNGAEWTEALKKAPSMGYRPAR